MDVFIGFIDTCMYLQNMDMNDKRPPQVIRYGVKLEEIC